MKLNFRAAFFACLALVAATTFAADTPKTIALTNGKDLTGWKPTGKSTNQWFFGKAAMDPAHPAKVISVGPGEDMICPGRSVNLVSDASYGDCVVELEYLLGTSNPKNDTEANSGIKLMNIYEIQIYDSYGKEKAGKILTAAPFTARRPH